MSTKTSEVPRRNKYDVDEILESEFSIEHLKRSGVYIRRHAKSLIAAFITSLISILAALAIPYLLMLITDEFIPAKDIRGIIITGLIGALLTVVIMVTSQIKGKICIKTGQTIVSEIRKDLFEHLQTLPFDYFDSRPHGKIMVRVVNYVNTIADFFANGIVNIVIELLSLIIIPFFMFATDVKLSIVILTGFIPFFVYIIFTKKAIRRRARIHSNKNSNINAYYQESINGMRITQSFSREDTNLQVAENMATDCKKSLISARYLQHTMSPLFKLVSALMTCLIYYFAIGGTSLLPVGVILAMATYCKRFWQPLINLGNLYNQIQDVAAYLERIFEILDTPSLIHDEEGAIKLPAITGNVEFCDVCFEYEEDCPILENVSFSVNAGQSIALVGPTGAGKTTIVNLLSRFYDIKSGKITIDGYNIHDVTLRSLRSQMGVMLQDTFIFAGTIMDNIKYGKLGATDEEAIAAAKTVCAHDFIKSLPKGYDTVVSERGASLSAGQRQLISFARTLLSDPGILILDEATSAMDTRTELLVQKGLNNLLKGRTSFIIAHRLSTIKNCDRIMYIADKNILESGTHEELLKAHGAYYKLYTAQLD